MRPQWRRARLMQGVLKAHEVRNSARHGCGRARCLRRRSGGRPRQDEPADGYDGQPRGNGGRRFALQPGGYHRDDVPRDGGPRRRLRGHDGLHREQPVVQHVHVRPRQRRHDRLHLTR